jgi:hypothetical protein
MTAWGWYWLAWLFAGFGIPELYWIFVRARNTLSDTFWGWEHLDRAHPFDFAEWTPLHYTLGIIFAIGLFWLFWHLIFGLWG